MTAMLGRWRVALTGITPVAVAGSLVCCALPIALVAAGAGSVMASLVSAVPWLVTVSRHKEWFFLAAGALLAVNYWALHGSGAACRPGGICHPSHPLGRRLRGVFWGSAALYAVALAAAYGTLPLLRAVGR